MNTTTAVKRSFKISFIFFIFIVSITAITAQERKVLTGNETKKINAEELKSLVAAPANKKPILLNFWATWCGPCHVEFPELVQIDTDYRTKGLNFLLVSVDDIGIIETRVPEFLEQYKATMPSYLIDLPNRREIAKAVRQIAPTFSDRYPLTLLFNSSGKLVFQKLGRIDEKILRREIIKVLPPKK